jgi:hypothetical protein
MIDPMNAIDQAIDPAAGPTRPTPDDDHFRQLELTRTQALVTRDLEAARRLHAPDYQLITPAGKRYALDGYLADLASGALAYARWDCGPIAVRATSDMALLRYRARLVFPSGREIDCWHTDSYERRGAAWLAVWSQATAVVASAAPP